MLIGHPSVRGQIGPRHDATDPATAKPDEIQDLAAVVDLDHQRRDVDARSKGHAPDGATDAGLGAVHQADDRVAPRRQVSSCRSWASISDSVRARRAVTRESSPALPLSSMCSAVMTGSHRLVDLGDLRPAFERFEVIKGGGASGSVLGCPVLVCRAHVCRALSRHSGRVRLVRQLQRQQLAGAMASSPRTTTVALTTSSRVVAALSSMAAVPLRTARRNQRGPSTPTKRTGENTVRPSGP